jgi:alpha-L-fucosidase
MRETFIPRGITRRDFLAASAAVAATAALPTPGAADVGDVVARGNRYRLQRSAVDARFGMFIHFNMGTFHDMEWVDPNQDPRSFNPTALDCGQWADAASAAGMRFALLTVKHHDGFCLWPTKLNTYNVLSSSYPHDVVRQYVEAFRDRGVTPGLYFSIWDRTQGVGNNGPATAADMEYIKGQLTELLTQYGPIQLLGFDGWAWQPNLGHHGAPFGEIRTHVGSLQPDCLIMDLNGLSVPWDSDLLFFEEPKGGIFCPAGNTYAATQGQSISWSGWFWHPSTPTTVRSAQDIVAGHLAMLEPRYCTFILNCPPNPQGLLDQGIVDVLHQTGQSWRPDLSRPPLPPQPDVLRHPVTPVSATASSGNAALAIDGHSDFGWNGEADQTLWTSDAPLPQSITLDLGSPYSGIDTLTYLPRQDTSTPFVLADFDTTGNISAYRVLVSEDGARFREVAQGRWAADHTLKQARFFPARARYVRLEARATAGGGAAVASEIDCGGADLPPDGESTR